MGTPPDSGILIIADEDSGTSRAEALKQMVGHAAARCRVRFERSEVFRLEPHFIPIEKPFSTPTDWADAITSLCRAKIVFVDITNYTPASMILLGIRAVVRRGVTITFTGSADELPWNIREIKPILLSKGALGYEIAETIALAMEDAWRRIGIYALYADLPVYHAIRSLPTGEYRALSPAELVLVLCSFSQRHQTELWPHLKEQLCFLSAEIADYKLDGRPNVVRTVDMHALTLVGTALYDAIRRSSLCIIDWTDWRPSVFFEFGVRLASSRIAPICVIEKNELPPAKSCGLEALRQLFDPIHYDVSTISTLSKQIGDQYRDDQRRDSLSDGEFGRATAPGNGQTYRAVVEALDCEHAEPPFRPPHVELCASARNLLGDPQSRHHPLLYIENTEIWERARAAARERLAAAWFYLAGRYTDEELRSNKDLQEQLEYVGEQLLEIEHRSTGASEYLIDQVLMRLDQLRPTLS